MKIDKAKLQHTLRENVKKAKEIVLKYKFISATVLVVALVIGTALCFSSCSQNPSGDISAISGGQGSQTAEEEKGGGLFGLFTKSDNNQSDVMAGSDETEEDPVILAYNGNTKEGYMNSCIFLGDSRTVAAVNYGFLQDDNVLAQVGIAHTSFPKNTFTNNSGQQYTMDSFLSSHPAPVIYVSLGVNGMNGLDEEKYKSTYESLVDDIMSKAPSSKLVIMSIWPVDDNGRYKNSVQNAWINKYNDFLLQLCEKKGIHYLNINEILTDSNGQMKREYNAGDGLHYAPAAYTDILEYIIHHPVPGVSDEGSFVVKKVAPNKAYQDIDNGNAKAREQIEAESQPTDALNGPNAAIQTPVNGQHTHSYAGATCTKPGVCSCGDVDPYGKTLSHNYVDGICSSCGRGDPNYSKHTHSYRAATCTSPETCSCGATRGSAKGHSYVSSSKTCIVCGGGSNPNYVAPSNTPTTAPTAAPTAVPTTPPEVVETPTQTPTTAPEVGETPTTDSPSEEVTETPQESESQSAGAPSEESTSSEEVSPPSEGDGE